MEAHLQGQFDDTMKFSRLSSKCDEQLDAASRQTFTATDTCLQDRAFVKVAEHMRVALSLGRLETSGVFGCGARALWRAV